MPIAANHPLRRRALGQIDPAVAAASVPEPPGAPGTGWAYFKFAVAAGLTVWVLTKVLGDLLDAKDKAPGIRLRRIADRPRRAVRGVREGDHPYNDEDDSDDEE